MTGKRSKRYMALRILMLEHSLTEDDLALVCECSRPTISRRMTGVLEWPMEDAYRVLEALKAPAEQLNVVFPRHGLA